MNTLVLPARIASLVGADGQASALGLLSFVGLFAGLLVQPLAGMLSDRWRDQAGRKGMLAVGAALVIIFLVVFGFSNTLLWLALGYLLIQVAGSITQAAQQGFIPDLVPAPNRGKASGWKAFMDIGGAMVGFVLLGQLLGSGQHRLALAVIGATLVIALAVTLLFVREKRSPAGEMPDRFAWWKAFQINLTEHRSFAWLVVSRFLFLLGTYAVGRFLLYFVADRLGLSADAAAAQAGSLLAVLALATILSAPLAGWASDRWGRLPVILFGSLISAVGVFLLIFAAGYGQILAFGILMSVGSGAFASSNWALTADLVPPKEPARFFGLANIGTAGAAAAAGLFGPLVDWSNAVRPGMGYPVLFSASALALVLSAVVLRWVRKPELVLPIEPIQAHE